MLGFSHVKSAAVLGVGLLACSLPPAAAPATANAAGKAPAEAGQARIDHGAELTFIFDNRPLNVAVDGVRPLLQSYWVNYIAHGDPNGAGLPQWPPYGGKRAYLAFTQAGPEARTALRAPICALLQRP
jgi:para-nitrobenzyl esterase